MPRATRGQARPAASVRAGGAPGEEKVKTSVLVVVRDAAAAVPLMRWSLHEVDRRGSRLHIYMVGPSEGRVGRAGTDAALERLGVADQSQVELVEQSGASASSIRAEGVVLPSAVIVTGPTDQRFLTDLVFGPGPHPSDEPIGPPVIVVPRSAWSTSPSEPDRPVLTVGFHASPPSIAAINWAVEEAEQRGGLVHAVLAWSEGEYASVGGPVPIESHLHGLPGVAAHQLIRSKVLDAGFLTATVEPIARRGFPARILTREAIGSDLLVVGSGRSIIYQQRVLGPTTLSCISSSPVPVAIVPSRPPCSATAGEPGSDAT